MEFSKFEFRPMESFQYIGGFLVWTVQKQQARNTLFWTVGVVRMQIWVLHSNLHSFGNISIISGIIQGDQKISVHLTIVL
jgi:hypothetical protein